MAKISRVLPMAIRQVGLRDKIPLDKRDFIRYPMCPAPVTRSSSTKSAATATSKKRKAKKK